LGISKSKSWFEFYTKDPFTIDLEVRCVEVFGKESPDLETEGFLLDFIFTSYIIPSIIKNNKNIYPFV